MSTPASHSPPPAAADSTTPGPRPATPAPVAPVREIGGPAGAEPTRYGDWERNGRCIDF